MPELGGGRPAPVLEPRPPEGMGRHTGVGYEVLLDVRVPQMGAQEAERALPAFLQRRKEEEEAAEEERMEKINEKVLAQIPLSSAERAACLQWMGLSSSSSSSGAKRRKKRKRRKKKVPKMYSSSHLLQALGRSGRDESAPGMKEVNKPIAKKVIRVGTGEEIILNNGKCWPDWWKNRHRHARRLGYASRRTGLQLTSTYSQVCYEEKVEQTRSDEPSDKTVKALIWLLFDTSSQTELQLGQVNAVCVRIHRMLKIGLSIDDNDEGLSDDVAPTMLEEASNMEKVGK